MYLNIIALNLSKIGKAKIFPAETRGKVDGVLKHPLAYGLHAIRTVYMSLSTVLYSMHPMID